MKKVKELNLYVCFFILAMLVSAVLGGYYLHLFHASKVTIDVSKLSEISDKIEVSNIEKGKLFSKIEVKISKNEENLKDFVNFTNGPGKGDYINYNIILEKGNRKYKIKTILKENNEEEIIIEGYVKNRFLQGEQYQIGILQKDLNNESREKFYQYTTIDRSVSNEN